MLLWFWTPSHCWAASSGFSWTLIKFTLDFLSLVFAGSLKDCSCQRATVSYILVLLLVLKFSLCSYCVYSIKIVHVLYRTLISLHLVGIFAYFWLRLLIRLFRLVHLICIIFSPAMMWHPWFFFTEHLTRIVSILHICVIIHYTIGSLFAMALHIKLLWFWYLFFLITLAIIILNHLEITIVSKRIPLL